MKLGPHTHQQSTLEKKQKLSEDICLWFSCGYTALVPKFHLHQSHLEGFGKRRCWAAPRVSVDRGAGATQEVTFLSSSRCSMLLVRGPHLENCCLRLRQVAVSDGD